MYIPINNPQGGDENTSSFSAMEKLVNARLPFNKGVFQRSSIKMGVGHEN